MRHEALDHAEPCLVEEECGCSKIERLSDKLTNRQLDDKLGERRMSEPGKSTEEAMAKKIPNPSEMDRRQFLRLSGGFGLAALTAPLLAACGGSDTTATTSGGATTTTGGATTTLAPGTTAVGPGSGRYGGPAPTQIGGQLTFVAGGSEGPVYDARKKYIWDVLEEDYGVDVTVITDLDYALIEAQIRTDTVEWDVIDADAFFAARAASEGWLEAIDYDIIDASQLIPGAAKEFSILQGVGAHHIAWNTEQAYGSGAGPQTWAEFYDLDAFPGRRALRSGALQTLPGAAMAAGVAPEDLYPLDLDLAFESLSRVKDSVVKWVDGGQAMQDLALGGEADLFNFYTSRGVTLKNDGEPIDFRFEQGSAEEADMIILKNSPNTLQAQHALAVSFNTPEYHKVLAEATNIGFSNAIGMDLVDPAIKPLLSTAPQNYELLAPAGNDWWAENQADASQRMAEFILS